MPIVFGSSPKQCCSNASCLPPAPDNPGCSPCCDPCASTCNDYCEPRTNARDAIRIERGEEERIIDIESLSCNPDTPIPAIRTSACMVLRKRGSTCEVMRIEPYRATPGGGLVFRWGPHFKSLPEGYYEADIHINNCDVATLLFYIPHYRNQATSTEYVVGQPTCCENTDCGCGSHHCSGCCSGRPVLMDEEICDQTFEGCGNAKCR